MADLVVAAGTTIVLNDTPPVDLEGNLERVHIRTLNDLVDQGIIKSRENLDRLLGSSKTVTTAALRDRATFTPLVRVVGRSDPDLRRFGSFRAASSGISSVEMQSFWRIARLVDPEQLAGVTVESDLSRAINSSHINLKDILKFLFDNVTVESGATLRIEPSVQAFQCHDLLIKRSGRVVVAGGGLHITAHSIAGEQ